MILTLGRELCMYVYEEMYSSPYCPLFFYVRNSTSLILTMLSKYVKMLCEHHVAIGYKNSHNILYVIDNIYCLMNKIHILEHELISNTT